MELGNKHQIQHVFLSFIPVYIGVRFVTLVYSKKALANAQENLFVEYILYIAMVMIS